MHRWLLLAYPRDYRRARGAEILETVADIAPTRRRLRVAVNLIGHGLRARLGRPASRGVVAWATIFTLACGLFAASFATWLTWAVSEPLDRADLAAAVSRLYPDVPDTYIGASAPAAFVVYGSPLSWSAVDDLLLGDGGEYSLATIDAAFGRLPAGTREQTLTDLQQRLRAAGWEHRGPVHTDAYDCIPGDARCDPAGIPSDITVYAMRGDDILDIHIHAPGTSAVMEFVMTRSTPGSAYPAGVAAFVAGALGAWCLFGWASRRTERGHRLTRLSTALLYGSAMFLWWAPILLSVPFMVSHHLAEPHFRWHPLWEWLGQPTLSLPFLLGGLMLTAAVALTALAHPRPAGHPVAHA
jgi:hypothetical protein